MTVTRVDRRCRAYILLCCRILLGRLVVECRDTSPLAQICARVDYVNSLQENLHGQLAGDEVGAELKALVEQCRTALRNRADEND